jgi:hypothetical protein
MLGLKPCMLSKGSDSGLPVPPKRSLWPRLWREKRTPQLQQVSGNNDQVFPLQTLVNQQLVPLRMCAMCQSYASPRTYHCCKCDRCCQGFHYHCSWLNNDIGERNLPVFIASLITSLLSCIYAVVFAALHLDRLARLDHFDRSFRGIHLPDMSDYTGSLRNAVAGSPTSVVVFAMGLIGSAFLVHRLGLHLLCACKAQTVLQRVSYHLTVRIYYFC